MASDAGQAVASQAAFETLHKKCFGAVGLTRIFPPPRYLAKRLIGQGFYIKFGLARLYLNVTESPGSP
jgi:hypothetical protein